VAPGTDGPRSRHALAVRARRRKRQLRRGSSSRWPSMRFVANPARPDPICHVFGCRPARRAADSSRVQFPENSPTRIQLSDYCTVGPTFSENSGRPAEFSDFCTPTGSRPGPPAPKPFPSPAAVPSAPDSGPRARRKRQLRRDGRLARRAPGRAISPTLHSPNGDVGRQVRIDVRSSQRPSRIGPLGRNCSRPLRPSPSPSCRCVRTPAAGPGTKPSRDDGRTLELVIASCRCWSPTRSVGTGLRILDADKY
jgi:hypothetical protein